MIEWRILTTDQAQKLWSNIEAETRDCLKTAPNSPANTIEHIKDQVFAGHLRVMTGLQETKQVGTAIVRIKGTMAYVVSITGTGISDRASIRDLYRCLRELGVKRLEALCRPSAARLWKRVGLETKYHLMEVNIWADL